MNRYEHINYSNNPEEDTKNIIIDFISDLIIRLEKLQKYLKKNEANLSLTENDKIELLNTFLNEFIKILGYWLYDFQKENKLEVNDIKDLKNSILTNLKFQVDSYLTLLKVIENLITNKNEIKKLQELEKCLDENLKKCFSN